MLLAASETGGASARRRLTTARINGRSCPSAARRRSPSQAACPGPPRREAAPARAVRGRRGSLAGRGRGGGTLLVKGDGGCHWSTTPTSHRHPRIRTRAGQSTHPQVLRGLRSSRPAARLSSLPHVLAHVAAFCLGVPGIGRHALGVAHSLQLAPPCHFARPAALLLAVAAPARCAHVERTAAATPGPPSHRSPTLAALLRQGAVRPRTLPWPCAPPLAVRPRLCQTLVAARPSRHRAAAAVPPAPARLHQLSRRRALSCIPRHPAVRAPHPRPVEQLPAVSAPHLCWNVKGDPWWGLAPQRRRRATV